MEKFINLYQLSKTLRFELKPVGKTLENIEKAGLLISDEQRAESYKLVKKIINEHHKKFVDDSLKKVQIGDISIYESLYFKSNRDVSEKKQLEILQKKMRKQIADIFGKSVEYKRLFGKEMIKEDLALIAQNDEELQGIKEFENFTTYFTGFNENRKNMYSPDEKSTSIGFRLINENLPKFLNNKRVFDKILKEHPQIIFDAKLIIEPYLNGVQFTDMFTYDFFNYTLRQKDIDLYNLMLGGISNEKEKIKGLNEIINLYRQEKGLTKRDIPNLSILYKQILSDSESFSYIPEKFNTPQEVFESIRFFYINEIQNYSMGNKFINVIEKLQTILCNFENYNYSKIFLKNDLTLTNLSKQLFDDWALLGNALKEYYYISNPKIKKSETNDSKIDKIKFFSIAEIESAMKYYCHDKDDLVFTDNIVFNYFSNFKQKSDEIKLNDKLEQGYSRIQNLLSKEYSENKSLITDNENVEKIKYFLDTILEILHFIKPLTSQGYEGEKDDAFYTDFIPLAEQLNKAVMLYNKVRNYITQKEYSVEKYKLNFENSTLLDGWDQNKEKANSGVLLTKDGLYYLGIMNKKHNKIFEEIPESNGDVFYDKIIYKLLPGASKMLPKVFFSGKNIRYFAPSKEILRIRNHGTHTKNGEPQKGYEKHDFNIDDCRTIIDFFKDSIFKHPEWKNFGFEFKPTSSYNTIDEFYREVESQGYNIKTSKIDEVYINKLIDEGKLYLFQIYNKDFSPHSKGRPNLHTLYWKALFSKENLNNTVYKLNGQAEIFFRKKSIIYPEEVFSKGHHQDKLKDKFDYPIISKRRFAYDKFQFHVPITLNFKANGSDNINLKVLDYLRESNDDDIFYIGIDRGERHLLYLSMINSKGEIIKQFSLNDIVNEYNNQEFTTNYHDLLSQKEKIRAESRTKWKAIETIKELKEGYISQVVHVVAKLMIENKAILLMEDLNFGFKRGRFKVEKQVYQKFEKMLIDKLNYYVDKRKKNNEISGVLNALQLTSKFTSFKEMGKQNGFIFYIPAWNTSKIDPITGFVNLFYTKYENITNAVNFFNKFEFIRFNNKNQYFEFVVNNYTQFNPKAEGTRQDWIICSYGERIINFRNKNGNWDCEEVNITLLLKNFFDKFNIKFLDGKCLKNQISKQLNKQFFEELFKLFKLTLQMRNSIPNSEIDYLISPVKDANGLFFDSRNAIDKMPKDADANGAYNIARKGILLVNKIKSAESNKKIDFKQTNKEWLNFVQN